MTVIETGAKALFKNLAYIGLSIGVPVYYLWFNYELVATYDTVTKLKVAGLIVTLIGLFFAKGYFGAMIYGLPLTVFKKFLWGVERILPLIGVYMAVELVVKYGQVAQEIVLYTAIANLFAFVVAPDMVVNKKNITGK